jgi:hypothetical protein
MFSSTFCFCYVMNPDVRSSSARVGCILCGHNLLDALMWMYGRRVIQTLDFGMMKGRCRTWAFLSISLDASKVSTLDQVAAHFPAYVGPYQPLPHI